MSQREHGANLLHNDNNMRLSPLNPLVGNLVHRILTSAGKSTSRNVQEHWQRGTFSINGSNRRSPDGEIKTVFRLPTANQELSLVGRVDGRSIGELLHAGVG